MPPLLCTFNLDRDAVRNVCRVLREHHTAMLAANFDDPDAAPFAQVAHELVVALEVAEKKLADEKAWES